MALSSSRRCYLANHVKEADTPYANPLHVKEKKEKKKGWRKNLLHQPRGGKKITDAKSSRKNYNKIATSNIGIAYVHKSK